MPDLEWFPAVDSPQVEGRFVDYKIYDIKKSKEQDQYVYMDVVRLEIRVQGSVDTTPHKLTRDNRFEHIKRFPEAWADYTKNKPKPKGTPLTKYPKIDDDKALNLTLSGFTTHEAFSEATDDQCESLGFGFRTLKGEVQEFLATPKKRGRPRKVKTDDAQDGM